MRVGVILKMGQNKNETDYCKCCSNDPQCGSGSCIMTPDIAVCSNFDHSLDSTCRELRTAPAAKGEAPADMPPSSTKKPSVHVTWRQKGTQSWVVTLHL